MSSWPSSARVFRILALAASVFLLFFFFFLPASRQSWPRIPLAFSSAHKELDATTESPTGNEWSEDEKSLPIFTTGQAKPPGSNYTRGLTVGHLKSEDVSWIAAEHLDVQEFLYVVDDSEALLRPPQNKGHEAMVYLTYIIDFYDSLPDVSLFMHAHQYSIHNSKIFHHDATAMIRHLSNERVMREGYVNMRCELDPGCPNKLDDYGLFEGGKEWKEKIVEFYQTFHPGSPAPTEMSAPCCAQFALSKERILATPRGQYLFYRDFLMQLDMDDHSSGRVWEYLWHLVFTGETVLCLDSHVCHCDTYGVCFDGPEELHEWFSILAQSNNIRKQLESLGAEEKEGGNAAESALNSVDQEQAMQIQLLDLDLRGEEIRQAAFVRGRDPKVRAKVAGRAWKDGDGY